jgi:hypothetical protein
MVKEGIDGAGSVVGVGHGLSGRWRRRQRSVAWTGYVIMVRWRRSGGCCGHASCVFTTEMRS